MEQSPPTWQDLALWGGHQESLFHLYNDPGFSMWHPEPFVVFTRDPSGLYSLTEYKGMDLPSSALQLFLHSPVYPHPGPAPQASEVSAIHQDPSSHVRMCPSVLLSLRPKSPPRRFWCTKGIISSTRGWEKGSLAATLGSPELYWEVKAMGTMGKRTSREKTVVHEFAWWGNGMRLGTLRSPGQERKEPAELMVMTRDFSS